MPPKWPTIEQQQNYHRFRNGPVSNSDTTADGLEMACHLVATQLPMAS